MQLALWKAFGVMAEMIRQTDEVRQRFAQVIDRKERERRAGAVERLEKEHPIVGPILSPLKNLLMFNEDLRNWDKGHQGEGQVARALRKLPSPWWYLNDVVFERKPDEYMQIDHIAIGPSVVAVIETKNWRGAIQGYGDNWKLKPKGRWAHVSSPTRQAVWHAKAVERYLLAMGFKVTAVPVVVFIDPEWIRFTDPGCPVFSDIRAMRDHLLSPGLHETLTPDQCREVAQTIAVTFPLYEVQRGGLAPEVSSDPLSEPIQAVTMKGEEAPANRATQKQRDYAGQLLESAGLRPVSGRLDRLTRDEAQAVINRLRFHKDVSLPDGLVDRQ